MTLLCGMCAAPIHIQPSGYKCSAAAIRDFNSLSRAGHIVCIITGGGWPSIDVTCQRSSFQKQSARVTATQVSFLICSQDEKLYCLSLTEQQRAGWMSLQLPGDRCQTYVDLLQAVQEVHNMRNSGNPFFCEPVGLPSFFYDMRQTCQTQQPKTEYYLLRMGPHGGCSPINLAAPAYLAMDDGLMYDSTTDLCVLAVRGAFKPCICLFPVHPKPDSNFQRRRCIHAQ